MSQNNCIIESGVERNGRQWVWNSLLFPTEYNALSVGFTPNENAMKKKKERK